MTKEPTYEKSEQRMARLEKEANEREQVEDEWRSLLRNAPDIILKLDRDGKILFINHTVKGYTIEETIGRTVYEYIPPEYHDKVRESIEHIFKTGDIVSFEFIGDGPGGVLSWYSSRLGPVTADGKVVAVTQISTDITEKKHAEDALQQSEEMYSTVVENAKEGIIIIQDNKIVYINPVVERLSPFSKDEVFSEAFPYFIHPEDRETLIQRYLQVKEGKSLSETQDYRIVDKEKNIRWVTVNSTRVNYRGKRAVLVFLSDITQRKLKEKALKESEGTARALLNAPLDSAVLIDVEGTVLDINEIAARRLRTTVDEIKGKCIYDFFPPELVKSRKERAHKAILTGHPVRFEDVRYGRNIYTNIYPVWDQNGEVTRLAVFGFDITERKQAEEALKSRERDLEIKSKTLEETNTTLRILLQKRETDKAEFEQTILSNVNELVMPYLEKLKNRLSDETTKSYLNILESNLNDIISPFLQRPSIKNSRLTPAQIQVANLVKEGKTTKEIADLLGLSQRTIEDHRKSIRTKLGIVGKNINLKSFLTQMQ